MGQLCLKEDVERASSGQRLDHNKVILICNM